MRHIASKLEHRPRGAGSDREAAARPEPAHRVGDTDQTKQFDRSLLGGGAVGPKKVAARPGFGQIPAVRNGAVYEIKSPLILQPGPAALTDGLKALRAILEQTE